MVHSLSESARPSRQFIFISPNDSAHLPSLVLLFIHTYERRIRSSLPPLPSLTLPLCPRARDVLEAIDRINVTAREIL